MNGFPFTPWVKVPKKLSELVEQDELSSRAAWLYVAMLSRTDSRHGVLSVRTRVLRELSGYSGCSDTLHADLRRLRELGLLVFDDVRQGQKKPIRFVVLSERTAQLPAHFRSESGAESEVTSDWVPAASTANSDGGKDSGVPRLPTAAAYRRKNEETPTAAGITDEWPAAVAELERLVCSNVSGKRRGDVLAAFTRNRKDAEAVTAEIAGRLRGGQLPPSKALGALVNRLDALADAPPEPTARERYEKAERWLHQTGVHFPVDVLPDELAGFRLEADDAERLVRLHGELTVPGEAA